VTGAHFGVALVLAATLIEGFAQVFLKKAALSPGGKTGWRVLGFATFGVEALVYTWSLRFVAVSVAFPLGSLSFVAVTLLSRCLLRETVDRNRWFGIFLILVGASLVAGRA
jgi:drug/metabolite transporter (DMT)-like permease